MTLEAIKQQIEDKTIIVSFVIFKADNTFIPHQYINEISKIRSLPIEYIEDLHSLGGNSLDIFFGGSINTDTALRVHHCDTFDFCDASLKDETNLIVVCQKINKSVEDLFKEYIIDVPTLEHWCIKDYLYSNLTGLDTRYIDWLMDVCSYNINRLQLEADKLSIFNNNERNIVFNAMLEDDAFSDISNKTIFDFTDAILRKNIKSIINMWDDLKNVDVEPLGVVTILYKGFYKYLSVWYAKEPTPETTGLSSKQIWAIKNLPHSWSEKQLVDILEFLSTITYRLRLGELNLPIIIDYILVNILAR